jgi:hypothetical protein
MDDLDALARDVRLLECAHDAFIPVAAPICDAQFTALRSRGATKDRWRSNERRAAELDKFSAT